eukprot:10445531-Alexandrium_andersonii.AAC.1
MSASLVGSEMCIRDSGLPPGGAANMRLLRSGPQLGAPPPCGPGRGCPQAVSYTHLTLPTICSV